MILDIENWLWKSDFGLLVMIMSFSSMFGKWFSCKSWQDTMISSIRNYFQPIGAKCTESKYFGIFTVLECTPPLKTEVVLIKIIWGIMAHVLGLFWICSFFCQTPDLQTNDLSEGPAFDQGKILHKTINTYGEIPPFYFCRNTFKTIYIYVKVTIFF